MKNKENNFVTFEDFEEAFFKNLEIEFDKFLMEKNEK